MFILHLRIRSITFVFVLALLNRFDLFNQKIKIKSLKTKRIFTLNKRISILFVDLKQFRNPKNKNKKYLEASITIRKKTIRLVTKKFLLYYFLKSKERNKNHHDQTKAQ